MPSSSNRVVFDVKYVANRHAEIVRNVMLGGFRLRESDNAATMAVQSSEDRKTFHIDTATIEWVRVDGRMRKLRSPAGQHRQREAELKFLLQGNRDGLSDPSLRSYAHDEVVEASRPRKQGMLGEAMTIVGMFLVSLPGLAMLGVMGLIGYIVWTMFEHMH